MEYDYETSQYGLETLTDRLMPLLCDKNLSEDDKEELFSLFFKHMMKVGRLAISKKDEIFVINLLETVEHIVSLRIENPKNRKVSIALITELGIESANQGLEHATKKGVILLDEIFSQIPDAKKHDGDIVEVFLSLQSIGEIVVKQKMKPRLSLEVLSLLHNIIESTILKKYDTIEVPSKASLEYEQKRVKYLLETFFQSIGNIAFETKSKNVLGGLSFYLMLNGTHIIAKKWDNDILLNILKWLVEIGEFAIEEKNTKKLEKTILDHIQQICNTAINYKNESIALEACNSELKLRPNSYKTWVKKGDVLIIFNYNMKAIDAYEEANKIKLSYEAFKGIQKGWQNVGNREDAENARDDAASMASLEHDTKFLDSM